VGFIIKRERLTYIAAKALFLNITLMFVLGAWLVSLLVIPLMFCCEVQVSVRFSMLFDEEGRSMMGYLFLWPILDPEIFWMGLFALFALLLSPSYLRRHDRLRIDDHGISFDCHACSKLSSLHKSKSWRIAWQDIQLPIVHHANFLNKCARLDTLYIQSLRPDDIQTTNKWLDLLHGVKTPFNPAFKLDMVSAWQADEDDADSKNSGLVADKRPAVVREIERYLGQGVVKRTCLVPFALSRQLAETRRSHKPDIVALGMGIGALFLFMSGMLSYSPYWLNQLWIFFVIMVIITPITAISLWLLRCRRRNSRLTSLVTALLFSGTFAWNIVQPGADYHQWQQETRVFVLQAPLPCNPSCPQGGEGQSSPAIQIWQSFNEGQGGAERLELKICADLARQPHQPGDKIELPVRRGLLGQYVLDIVEANEHFKTRPCT